MQTTNRDYNRSCEIRDSKLEIYNLVEIAKYMIYASLDTLIGIEITGERNASESEFAELIDNQNKVTQETQQNQRLIN